MNCYYIKPENDTYVVSKFQNFSFEVESETDIFASDYVYDAIKLLFLDKVSQGKITKLEAESYIEKNEAMRNLLHVEKISQELEQRMFFEFSKVKNFLNEHR